MSSQREVTDLEYKLQVPVLGVEGDCFWVLGSSFLKKAQSSLRSLISTSEQSPENHKE